jgi:hypothetical protein
MQLKSPKVKPPTEIKPIGLIANSQGEVMNLKNHINLDLKENKNRDIPLFLVVGSSMNAGKTTTVANIIKGLRADGYQVGAAKVTGTGSGGDLWHFKDAGVNSVIDFTDAGYVSTYKIPIDQLIRTFQNMVLHLKNQQVDAIVIEVADGILQQETEQLLCSDTIKNMTSSIIYAAGDSSSSLYGYNWLTKHGYAVNAISGVVSSIPLAKVEVENRLNIPVVKKTELSQAGFGHSLMENHNQSKSAVTNIK